MLYLLGKYGAISCFIAFVSVSMYSLAASRYLNLLKQLMAIRSSICFSHLRPGTFHIALQTHKTQLTQLRGWKTRRTKKHGLGLAPSTRRDEFLRLFSGFFFFFCASVGYRERVSERNSHTSTRWLTWLLSAQVQTPRLAPSLDFC